MPAVGGNTGGSHRYHVEWGAKLKKTHHLCQVQKQAEWKIEMMEVRIVVIWGEQGAVKWKWGTHKACTFDFCLNLFQDTTSALVSLRSPPPFPKTIDSVQAEFPGPHRWEWLPPLGSWRTRNFPLGPLSTPFLRSSLVSVLLLARMPHGKKQEWFSSVFIPYTL